MNDWIAFQITAGCGGLMFAAWRKNIYAGLFMYYALLSIQHHQ